LKVSAGVQKELAAGSLFKAGTDLMAFAQSHASGATCPWLASDARLVSVSSPQDSESAAFDSAKENKENQPANDAVVCSVAAFLSPDCAPPPPPRRPSVAPPVADPTTHTKQILPAKPQIHLKIRGERHEASNGDGREVSRVGRVSRVKHQKSSRESLLRRPALDQDDKAAASALGSMPSPSFAGQPFKLLACPGIVSHAE
jgi:hypothetical protein